MVGWWRIMLGRRRCDNKSVAQTMTAIQQRFPPRGRIASYHPRKYLLGFRTSPKFVPCSVRGSVAVALNTHKYVKHTPARTERLRVR
eukprot:4076168-Heterocapsa_arctica.AAC.1